MELSEINELTGKYAVVKGFIDARDALSRPVYGAFVFVSDIHRTVYLDVHFSDEPIDKGMSASALVKKLSAIKAEHESEGIFARSESEFASFVSAQGIFLLGKSRLDSKEIERKISYFCSEELDLNAIVFVDVTTMGEDSFASLFPSLLETATDESSDTNDGEPAEDADVGGEDPDDEHSGDVYLACGPVLDTVNGTAIRDLLPGDHIDIELPKTSMYYQFIRSKDPTFNGRLDAEISGIKLDEFGAAVVAIKIADGVYGTLRLSESVKIKKNVAADLSRSGMPIPPEYIFAAFCIVFFIAVICVLIATM